MNDPEGKLILRWGGASQKFEESFIPKVYKTDADGKVLYPKKSEDNMTAIHTECIDYLKNYNQYSNTVMGAFIDNVNYLIGTEQCNYFSNFFSISSF